MLPCNLKLSGLAHCYIYLPSTFIEKEQSIKTGAIISITSIQNDTELLVIWNGQISPDKHAQLDMSFALANDLPEGLVTLQLAKDIETPNCSLCRFELLDNSDHSIISQHSEANLLDTCRLVSKNLIIPIWLSQNVKIMVKVVHLVPGPFHGMLTKSTEMQNQFSPTGDIPSDSQKDEKKPDVINPVPFISSSLGIDFTPKFYPGIMLICGERGSGKTHYLRTIVKNYNGFKSELFDCNQLRLKRVGIVKKTLTDLIEKALRDQPFILCLDNIDSLTRNDLKNDNLQGTEVVRRRCLVDAFCYIVKSLERMDDKTNRRVCIVTTCRSFESLDAKLSKAKGRSYFGEIIKLVSPSVQKRVEILNELISEYKEIRAPSNDKVLEEVAKRCGSFMPLDLRRLIERSIINSCSRSLNDFSSEPMQIKAEDLMSALEGYVPANLRGVNLKPKSSRTFDSVGGMNEIKEILRRTIMLQIKYPKLYKKCPVRTQTSILLYGPPGCGKTTLAEALTNEEGLNSICIKGPELLSKYLGGSEAAVRDLFHRAEMARPCLIFFDEFESLVSKRGVDSTGVTDRVVNQFLTLMDGVEQLSSDVFILAASSRPDLIDPAILRPGRLDRHIYCPVPNQSDRLEILEVMVANLEFDSINAPNLQEWSSRLEGFTGADIQSLLYSAQLRALHEIIECNSKDNAMPNESSELEVKINQSHMELAYMEMKSEVKSRCAAYARLCPATIRVSKGAKVAARATLA